MLAAKVTLMNRVNQIYNDDLAVKMVLVNGTDKLNLQTPTPRPPAPTAPVARPPATRGLEHG